MSINRDMESIWTLLERAKTVYLACTSDGVPCFGWCCQSAVKKAAPKPLKHRLAASERIVHPMLRISTGCFFAVLTVHRSRLAQP